MSTKAPIVVFCPDPAHYFFSSFYGQIYFGILREATTLGIALRFEDRLEKIKTLNPSDISGLIFIGRPNPAAERWLRAHQHWPIVLACHVLENSAVKSVAPNGRAGIRIITDYLLKNGHRTIAYLSGMHPDKDPVGRERLDGFMDAINASKFSVDASVVYHDLHKIQTVDTAFKKIMRAKPTALVFMADVLAYRFMAYAKKNKIRIPQDVSIVGFDGIEAPAGFEKPRLTTVVVDVAGLGAAAVTRLFNVSRK